MKYSEFKAEVEKMGFEVNVKSLETRVRRKGNTIVTIDAKHKCIVDTAWDWFQMLTDETQVEIFDLACQLAKTPLAEREEEKRYRLLSVFPMLRKNECGYLLYHREYDKYYTGNTNHWGLVYQTIFTESEIAEMDITGFEKIEVSND